jgi:acyl carrier protein
MDFISSKLFSCFNELGIEKSSLSDSAHIIKDLGLDSLDLADLVMRLEMAFNINIPDTDWSEIQTFGDIQNYLSNRINTPALN